MKWHLTSLMVLIGCELLAQPTDFTFTFLNKKPDAEKITKEQSEKLMEGHMANIKRLASEGKLLAAGPFEGGGGIFVFNSGSMEQVKEWINTDPAVKANRWNVEILPYKPILGSICKVGEKYEMISYHFIRFWLEIKKFTVNDAPQLILQHEDFWKNQHQTTPLITFASFGENEGDILVSASPIEEAVLVNDPAIRAGLIRFEKKMLFIAKGSFCENK
jgi:uncharacterized protein YciI